MVKRVVIDCKYLSDRRRAHEYLSEVFNFPDYYGKNLDALFDCLTELGECTVVLEGAESSKRSDNYGARVIKVIEAAARANSLLRLETYGQSDKIISVLLGLIGACNNNPKTENTDAVVLKALAVSKECSEESEKGIISEILAEKNEISPGCAVCAMPCGNTSDYDMNRIYSADEAIRDVKLRLISELTDMSEYLYDGGVRMLPDDTADVIYRALAYISYDLDEKTLAAMLVKLEETNRQIRRK